MAGKNKPPALSAERLTRAKASQYAKVRRYATIVEKVKENTERLQNEVFPDLVELEDLQVQLDNLTGQERDDAYHIFWYMKEFALGRNPKVL